MPAVNPASVGAFPPITMSLPVVFDNVMVLSELSVAVTPAASWLISVTKFPNLFEQK